MSLGIQPTKADIDNLATALSTDLDNAMNRVQRMAVWLNAQADADIIALGYVQAEVTALRAAFSDMQALVGVYAGATAGTAYHGGTAYDARTHLRPLIGLRTIS